MKSARSPLGMVSLSAFFLATLLPASLEAAGGGDVLQSRADREIERIVTSPLKRLPSKARARGWAELGLHARAGEGPGTFVASPLGAAYYRLADPVYVTLMLGAVGEMVFDGDDSFRAEGHVGNPYLGFGFELPVDGVELQLVGGFTVPLATVDGGPAYGFAQGMRGAWSPWLWASRRLSVVAGARIDLEGEGPMRFGVELGAAPMFWFGEGSGPVRFARQGSAQASLVLAEVVDLGARGIAVSTGDGTQLSSELFANIQGARQRVYHARLTMPLNEPYGFAFSDTGVWGLHIGYGLIF